jgi:NAD+ synthase (glutamine-hydrolysing)
MTTAASARTLRVALAQLTSTVGDLDANTAAIAAAIAAAADAGCDLVVTPEMAVCGYPPDDLVTRADFVADVTAATARLVARTGPTTAVIGTLAAVAPTAGGDALARRVTNAAVAARAGHPVATVAKTLLPTYGVFDEGRTFVAAPADQTGVVTVPTRTGDVAVGVLVCEDLWRPDVAGARVAAGADVLVVINASPFWHHKPARRGALVTATAARCGRSVIYLNSVGAHDGIVFDGNSMIATPGDGVVWRAPAFAEHHQIVDVPVVRARPATPPAAPPPAAPAAEPTAGSGVDVAATWAALCLAVRRYVTDNGFDRVWIGLSGGIDSAVVAAVAADALGPDAVHGVTMPGPYSSPASAADAAELAARLGIDFDTVTIDAAYQLLAGDLAAPMGPDPHPVALENLQARLRGTVLMALSNARGGIVLTTGNKSELAVGYCTLYGDMVGGFAVLADVPKTLVCDLARWRNTWGPGDGPIPARTIDRPPSAELAADQVDTDTLPPYEVLDDILARYVEHDASVDDIVAAGHDPVTVTRIVALVDRNEYKRRQAAPGVKLTARAFGRDRRLPVTNRWQPTATAAVGAAP